MKARKARDHAAYLFEQGQGESSGGGRASAGTHASSSSRRGRCSGNDDDDSGLLSLSYSTKSGGKRKTWVRDGNDGINAVALANLEKAPGIKMLSDKEAELCAAMPLLPKHYLAAKEACVREAFRNGRLTVEGMRRVVTLDTPKEQQLFDFFVLESNVVTDGGGISTSKKAKYN